VVVKCKIYGSRNSFLHENIDGVNNPKNNDNNVYDENVNNIYVCAFYSIILHECTWNTSANKYS